MAAIVGLAATVGLGPGVTADVPGAALGLVASTAMTAIRARTATNAAAS